jgi:hypothetical protein
MSDMQDDAAGNDLDLEVSGLDEDAATHATEITEEASESPGIAQYDAHSSVEHDSRPRRHLLQASVTGLAVALAIAIILATFPGATSQLMAPVRMLTPEPTSTLPPGSDIILLAHTVPWGHLRVDGRTDAARDLGIANGYHAYRLPPGQHTLDYEAAPFPPSHCTVSAPKRTSDTCTSPGDQELASHPVGEALRALDMNATVATMDSHERAKLQALLENGASYPAITVEAGMHYLDQNGNVAIAREQMNVTMFIGAAQPTSDSAVNESGQRCGEFCEVSQQDDPAAWTLLANVKQRWMYTSADGGFTAVDTSAGDVTPVRVAWINNEWALLSEDYLLGNNCLFLSQFEHFNSIATQNGLFFSATIALPTSANGCVIEYSAGGSDNLPKAQILYRLGVTLAVNADAHRLFPDLLLASAAERAIAQVIRAGDSRRRGTIGERSERR